MHSGNYVLILHTHLPWVLHHGKWPHGEDWIAEAAAECYIPLLNVFNDLLNEGITPKVTLDISPVLCEQLEHQDFKDFFIEYCDHKIKSANEDENNFKLRHYDPHHIYLASWWADWYSQRKRDFIEKYNYSIINALKELQDKGAIEIMTCGATHGYSPLLGLDRSINLQFKAATENYKKLFGRSPRGTWLPECAYRPSYEWHSYVPVSPFNKPHLRPGIEQFLARNEIKYFVTDQPLLDRFKPLGVFADYTKERFIPLNSPAFFAKPWNFHKSPLEVFNVSSSEKTEYGTAAVFTRHTEIAMQVWSGEAGYPGEPDYLDFHKKHMESFLRYWRVTGTKVDMMYKSLYHPDWTRKKIDLQANHFIHHIENTLNYNKNITGKSGTLCTPFDTELFGHWWFEGPEFLKAVLRGLHNSPWVNCATASEELLKINPLEIVSIPEGSWGENNNHDVWSNSDNVWTWQSMYDDELRLNKLFETYPIDSLDDTARRICTQALRELMLLQSSDWQFLIHTQSAKDYAEQRFSFHHSDFNRLIDIVEDYLKTKNINEDVWVYLAETEKRNCPFPELKLEWWNEFA